MNANLFRTLWPAKSSRPAGWEQPGPSRDVIVVGGGFTGATLACALVDGHRRIRVLEARSSFPNRYAGELIHPTGVEELARLGLVAPLLAAGGVLIDGFSVHHDGTSPPARLAFSEIKDARPTGLAIDHHTMVRVLREEAQKRHGVTIETGVRVTELLREGERIVGVRSSDGVEHRADLVLSAEGRHSKLRAQLGFSGEPATVSMTAALLVPRGALPQPGHGHIFLGAWGPILAYPISHDEVRMCFDLPRGVVLDGLKQHLLAEYVPHVPEPLRAGLVSALETEPLQLAANQALFTPVCVTPGAALVGDVGGCAHPLTAAGMTICLRDIRYFADELNPEGTMARYEARRGHFVRSRALLTSALYHVMKGSDPTARWLRTGLMRYWQSPRARAASLALLTGSDTDWLHLVREYASVMLSSASAMSGR